MSLPFEVLHIIFSQLGGKDIVHCRRVCHLWRDAVDSLSDRTWKEIFLRENGKGGLVKMPTLSWKETYKSISLWAHVESDVITPNELSATYAVQFQVLSNGMLSVLQNTNGCFYTRVRGYGDTLIHYDLDTYQEVHRECFSFLFSDCSENDNYISAIDIDQNLCIIPKAYKHIFRVGKLLTFLYHRGVYTPCFNEVYFKNMHNMICVSTLVEENGEVTVKTEQLHEFKKHILAFSLGFNNDFYVLSIDGNIYHYKDKEFAIVRVFSDYSQRIYYYLDVFGFDWSSPAILFWMLDTEDRNVLGESKSEISAICRHKNVVLKGTYNRDINIYYNPYKVNGDFKSRIKPNRSISMCTYDNLTRTLVPSINSFTVVQLLIVEKLNGHKLIVLTAYRVIILNLDYKEIKKKVKVNRKRAHSQNKKRKAKKAKPKNPPKPKRRYNTRSSTRK